MMRKLFSLFLLSGFFLTPFFGLVNAESLSLDQIREIKIDQKLDAQLPLELQFRNEEGQSVSLKNLLGERPAILTLVYYRCPQLCTLVLNGLVKALRVINYEAGKEFNIITISIDPNETPDLAKAKKREYLKQYDKVDAAAGWHFLTGDQAAIKTITETVGFHYLYDERSKQFAHASAIMVLTPDGKLSRYFYGVEYSPKDLRFALIEASKGKIGNLVDQFLLLCYHYDPETGKYGFAIKNALRVGGIITIIFLGGFIFIALRKERQEVK